MRLSAALKNPIREITPMTPLAIARAAPMLAERSPTATVIELTLRSRF